jgi:hypothetical protein
VTNVSDKSCRENQKNPHFVLKRKVFHKIVPFMRKWWKNIVEPDSSEVTIWRMRIVCWIPKATDVHSEYVILVDFPLQQWLHERPSLLR